MNFHRKAKLRLIVLALCLVVLTGAVSAAPDPPGGDRLALVLKAQQSVGVTCLGDELIITLNGRREAEVTCRVWVRQP